MKNYLDFIKNNQQKLIALLLLAIILDYAGKFPYLNIYLMFPYPWGSLAIVWATSVLLFRLDERFTFGTALMLVTLCVPLSVFGSASIVEALGNWVYGLLFFGFVQIIVRTILERKA